MLQHSHFYLCHQLSGISAAHFQNGSGKYAAVRVKLLSSGCVGSQVDGIPGTYMGADPAALAGVFTDGINSVRPGDGIKAAMGLAEAAASAFFCVQDSLISAEKIRDIRSSGNLRYQVEVGGVHITVGHSLCPGKADEGRRGGGLSGAALSA